MQALTGFVYLWTNSTNGKKYVGSHIGATDDGYCGSGKAFLRAVKKHGIDAFERTILEGEIPVDKVREREQFYLDHFNAAASKEFYNMRAKAGGGFEYINNHPDITEMRKKQGASISRKWREEGHPKGMLGKHHDETTRARMARSIKAALVESIGRTVHCFDFSGNHVRSFPCIQEAAHFVNGSPSNIKYTCDGRFKAAYGYLWSYDENCPVVEWNRSNVRKGVLTPLGEFKTITAAAQAHNVNPLTLKRRIWRNDPGYEWLGPTNKSTESPPIS